MTLDPWTYRLAIVVLGALIAQAVAEGDYTFAGALAVTFAGMLPGADVRRLPHDGDPAP